jgi:hypothetical protein
MNKYVKMWIEGLRSGKYQQGVGQLANREVVSDDFCYCCLGVACEVMKEEFDLKVSQYDTYKSYEGAMTSLPNVMVSALNMRKGDGSFINEDGVKDCLIALNDTEGKTFAEIADLIESNPEGLFYEDE